MATISRLEAVFVDTRNGRCPALAVKLDSGQSRLVFPSGKSGWDLLKAVIELAVSVKGKLEKVPVECSVDGGPKNLAEIDSWMALSANKAKAKKPTVSDLTEQMAQLTALVAKLAAK